MSDVDRLRDALESVKYSYPMSFLCDDGLWYLCDEVVDDILAAMESDKPEGENDD